MKFVSCLFLYSSPDYLLHIRMGLPILLASLLNAILCTYIYCKEYYLYEYIDKKSYKKRFIKYFLLVASSETSAYFTRYEKHFELCLILIFALLFLSVLRAKYVKIELDSYTNKDNWQKLNMDSKKLNN